MASVHARLITAVNRLEELADDTLTVGDLEAARVEGIAEAIADGVLLVDYRTRLDGGQVVLCRLNRRHPDVAPLTAW